MEPARPAILIAADQYQFLDTVFGTTPATLQEWKVANSLERLRELAAQSPRAIVVDLEATCFSYTDVLNLLASMRVTALIVLLTGTDRVSARIYEATSPSGEVEFLSVDDATPDFPLGSPPLRR